MQIVNNLLDYRAIGAWENKRIRLAFRCGRRNNQVLEQKSRLMSYQRVSEIDRARGSSLVATSAPKRFAGIRRPRPLMHRAVHAIVSPKTLSRWKTNASRFGRTIGNCTGILWFAGPFNFFQASQIFVFIARKIFGAK